jgi:hypothetical protein
VLLVPNQTGDEYLMIGRISDLYNSVSSVLMFERCISVYEGIQFKYTCICSVYGPIYVCVPVKTCVKV